MRNIQLSALSITVFFFLGSLDKAMASDKWQFEISPYAWATTLEGDVGVRSLNSNVDVSLLDLMKDADSWLAILGHMELRNGKTAFFFEGNYVNLEFDGSSGPIRTSVESTLGILELGVAHEIARWGVDQPTVAEALGGLRYTSIESSIDLIPGPAAELSKDWFDPFVGFRTRTDLTDKIQLRLRGDFGGFGVGSDSTWQAIGLLVFDVPFLGQQTEAGIGYRALRQNYSEGSGTSRFKWHTTLHGPLVGLSFKF
ncbi:hypothetical protein [Sneathiella sp.]|jgi:hypothetical protein|uniref:hypothetical protein n=1 Tax=Sneathiella sp. TaxID=1964365 RepID=UPI0039E4D901